MRPAPRPAQRERVPRDSSTAITVRDIAHSHFSYPWHYHPESEIILIVAGRGLRYVGDSIGEFEPGDLCLVGGGTPHCWLSEPIPGHPVRALVIQFPPEVFGSDFLDLYATRPLTLLFETASQGVRIGGASRSRVAAEMWRLVDPAVHDLEKLVCLLGILTGIATSKDIQTLALTPGHRPTSPRDATRAGKVLRYIHDHACERLAQQEVASLVGMSAGAFSRFFTRHFGKPFVTYVAEVRISQACRLLVEQELNVSEIAYQVGFNNLANFNRHFLKLKGMTPSAYRKVAQGIG